MDESNSSTAQEDNREEFIMTFKNGALTKIKQIAKRLDISEDNLEQVVEKGIKALELPDDNKLIYKKGEGSYFIDIRNL